MDSTCSKKVVFASWRLQAQPRIYSSTPNTKYLFIRHLSQPTNHVRGFRLGRRGLRGLRKARAGEIVAGLLVGRDVCRAGLSLVLLLPVADCLIIGPLRVMLER
jgi:hypothetical protein